MRLLIMVGNVMSLKVGIIVCLIGMLNVRIVILLIAECWMNRKLWDGILIETTYVIVLA